MNRNSLPINPGRKYVLRVLDEHPHIGIGDVRLQGAARHLVPSMVKCGFIACLRNKLCLTLRGRDALLEASQEKS